MAKGNISQELWLKHIEETKNYFIKEMDQNEFTSNKPKKVCTTLNCFEHCLILDSALT